MRCKILNRLLSRHIQPVSA
jgi:cold shock protein